MKEQRYGLLVVDEGTIVYFEYDTWEEEWEKRTGSTYDKKFASYKGHVPETVLSFHFNYSDGTLLFIDASRQMRKLSP